MGRGHASNRQPAAEPAGDGALYIKQAARLVGVSPATIRAWERQGLLQPPRTPSGYRVYGPAEIRLLRRIRDLFQTDRLNSAGVRQMLRLSREEIAAEPAPPDGGTLGRRIRHLRARQGVSLRDVAARTGLSPSYISSIERSLNRPSVASLQKLAAALGTNLSLMLGEASADPEQVVVRPRDRRRLRLDAPGIVMEQLAAVERDLEPSLVRIAPGAGSEESYHHEGEEFVFVVEGAFEVTLDETETHLLSSGDAITFRSRRPHRWRNPGASETTLIWVNTPPTF